ncbi:MAG: type IV-A pilus assembly ATPase PilB [Thermodesulfobacteriota bacterium]|nr:type IV-A pilus assembly ATPase PilB [Thermodesulfobacteriota bacterium]
MAQRLGELLVRKNIITEEQLEKALEDQRNNGGRLGQALIRLGFLKESDLTYFLSIQYNVPTIDISEYEIDLEVIKLVPVDIVEKYRVIPVEKTDSALMLAVEDPSNIFAIDDVKFLTGLNVEVFVASDSSIRSAIDKYYDSFQSLSDAMSDFDDSGVDFVRDEEAVDVNELEKATEDAPVVKLVNLILTDAIKKGASDIHIEAFEKSLRVRLRIDGVLYEIMKPPMKMRDAMVSRLKIMSKLDIAERRLPQDGRIKLKMGRGKEMDFRVSVLPTLFGEKVVLRLLDKSNLQLDMTKLGFEEKALKDFKDSINKPFGMVLVTGPTGSGKTTTLYSALSELNKVSENISTAEDPVEFNLYGINQVQMHEEIGLTFANALRSFLRQDPDIIMVGEIRDFETAEISIKAALTGHLVLSTLHTNDAPSTINRLLNMGIEPFLVASSVNLILAQRLARKICQECKEQKEVPPQTLIELEVPEEEVSDFDCFHGKGCTNCSNTGYRGRVALYEVMPISEELKELILNADSASEIKRTAIRLGMKTLRQSGITKLKESVTTIEEVLRTTMPDH